MTLGPHDVEETFDYVVQREVLAVLQLLGRFGAAKRALALLALHQRGERVVAVRQENQHEVEEETHHLVPPGPEAEAAEAVTARVDDVRADEDVAAAGGRCQQSQGAEWCEPGHSHRTTQGGFKETERDEHVVRGRVGLRGHGRRGGGGRRRSRGGGGRRGHWALGGAWVGDGGHPAVPRHEAEDDVVLVLPVRSHIRRRGSLRGVVRFRVVEGHRAGGGGTVIRFWFVEVSLLDVIRGLLPFCERFVAPWTDQWAGGTVVVPLERHGVG